MEEYQKVYPTIANVFQQHREPHEDTLFYLSDEIGDAFLRDLTRQQHFKLNDHVIYDKVQGIDRVNLPEFEKKSPIEKIRTLARYLDIDYGIPEEREHFLDFLAAYNQNISSLFAHELLFRSSYYDKDLSLSEATESKRTVNCSYENNAFLFTQLIEGPFHYYDLKNVTLENMNTPTILQGSIYQRYIFDRQKKLFRIERFDMSDTVLQLFKKHPISQKELSPHIAYESMLTYALLQDQSLIKKLKYISHLLKKRIRTNKKEAESLLLNTVITTMLYEDLNHSTEHYLFIFNYFKHAFPQYPSVFSNTDFESIQKYRSITRPFLDQPSTLTDENSAAIKNSIKNDTKMTQDYVKKTIMHINMMNAVAKSLRPEEQFFARLEKELNLYLQSAQKQTVYRGSNRAISANRLNRVRYAKSIIRAYTAMKKSGITLSDEHAFMSIMVDLKKQHDHDTHIWHFNIHRQGNRLGQIFNAFLTKNMTKGLKNNMLSDQASSYLHNELKSLGIPVCAHRSQNAYERLLTKRIVKPAALSMPDKIKSSDTDSIHSVITSSSGIASGPSSPNRPPRSPYLEPVTMLDKNYTLFKVKPLIVNQMLQGGVSLSNGSE